MRALFIAIIVCALPSASSAQTIHQTVPSSDGGTTTITIHGPTPPTPQQRAAEENARRERELKRAKRELEQARQAAREARYRAEERLKEWCENWYDRQPKGHFTRQAAVPAGCERY